jgi:DNA polymerase-3 subunit delta
VEIQQAIYGGEDPGMGLVRLDPASLGPDAMAAVLDEIRTPSMFAPRKLVIVDPADPLFKKAEDAADPDDKRLGTRELLENYFAAPLDSATLVLVVDTWLKTTRLHKALDKVGAVRWCEPIKAFQAPAWVVRRAKEGYGKAIDPAAVTRLAELIGPDLQRLDNELAKLSLYQPDAPAIGIQAVDALVGFQHEQQIWDMINALAQRDAPTALKKIDEIWSLDSKIEYTATGAVFSWLNQVIKARELLERRMPDAMIGKELKLWPSERAQKVLTLARTWGLSGAARWSAAMLQMDVANKSSLGEPRSNMEKFVVQLCTA